MHGDRVLVELGSIRHDGRAEGRIVRVTEREQETVVGKFHYSPRHNYVTPIDAKVAVEIVIPQGMEYPSDEQTDEQEEVRPSLEDRKRHPRNAFKPGPHRLRGDGAKRANWDHLETATSQLQTSQ